MNKFLQYLNDTLISLDMPSIVILEEKNNIKRRKKATRPQNISQKK